MSKIHVLAPRKLRQLECSGVGRDDKNEKALVFYFTRNTTADEMRFLHNVMRRAVALIK